LTSSSICCLPPITQFLFAFFHGPGVLLHSFPQDGDKLFFPRPSLCYTCSIAFFFRNLLGPLPPNEVVFPPCLIQKCPQFCSFFPESPPPCSPFSSAFRFPTSWLAFYVFSRKVSPRIMFFLPFSLGPGFGNDPSPTLPPSWFARDVVPVLP